MMLCGIFILNKTQLQFNEVCYKVSLTENFQQHICSTRGAGTDSGSADNGYSWVEVINIRDREGGSTVSRVGA